MNSVLLSTIFAIGPISSIIPCYAHPVLTPAAIESIPSYSQEVVQGDWSGMLDFNGMKITLVLHIGYDEAGRMTAVLDSPDQGVTDIPVDVITFKGQLLKLEINNILAGYEGSLAADGSQITGTFTQNGLSLPLIFKTGVQVKRRPQEPKQPFPYKEEEVSYENKEAGLTLAGTLTLPRSDGPFPVVLLITGSGAHDRNETVFGHKPFLVLADYLTRQGIAVLRVDDRGVGKSTGKHEMATSADFSNDVLAGIEFLRSRQEINSTKIGLIGHSEGGIIAPMVAVKSRDIAFIVLMAGPGVSGEEILYEQAALITRVNGDISEELIENNRKLQEQMFAIVKKEADYSLAEKQLRKVVTKYLAELPEAQGNSSENILNSMEASIKRVNSAWFRYFLSYQPVSNLKLVKIPVLALNGELDLQVSPKQNLPVIAKALREAGNENITIVELPQLNHLFQTCKTGSITEYATIEETISPSALKVISDWILGISQQIDLR